MPKYWISLQKVWRSSGTTRPLERMVASGFSPQLPQWQKSTLWHFHLLHFVQKMNLEFLYLLKKTTKKQPIKIKPLAETEMYQNKIPKLSPQLAAAVYRNSVGVETSDLALHHPSFLWMYIFLSLRTSAGSFVRAIVVCDQLADPAQWANLVPGPEGIIRFGNVEDKWMLNSMHVHAHPHADKARVRVHARYILDYANECLIPPLKCTERGWRSVSAELNTEFKQRTCTNLWKLDTMREARMPEERHRVPVNYSLVLFNFLGGLFLKNEKKDVVITNLCNQSSWVTFNHTTYFFN